MAAAPSTFRSNLATNLRGAVLSPARPVDYKRQFFNPGVNNQFLRKPYCVQKLAGLGEPPHIIANMAITPHDDHRFILHAFFQESSGVYSAVLSCGAGTQGGIVQLQRHLIFLMIPPLALIDLLILKIAQVKENSLEKMKYLETIREMYRGIIKR